MKIEIGQRIIISKHRAAPAVAVVTHVTKTGQFQTDLTGEIRWMLRYGGPEAKKFGGGGISETMNVYENTIDKLAELQLQWAKWQSEQQREADARKMAQAEREYVYQSQLAQMRWYFPLSSLDKITLPDGSRAYHTVLRWTSGTDGLSWVYVMIVCQDSDEVNWKSETHEKKPCVRSSMTYLCGLRSSMPSCGSDYYDNDEIAVHAALAYAFFKVY